MSEGLVSNTIDREHAARTTWLERLVWVVQEVFPKVLRRNLPIIRGLRLNEDGRRVTQREIHCQNQKRHRFSLPVLDNF
jgi:hypothetical protein